MLDLEKPLAGKINGASVGLGATIALLCDVVVVTEATRIGDRHVNVGLIAGDGGAVIWPWLVGINRAKELLMTGELVQGDDLLRMGIANHVVPAEDLDQFCLDKARQLAGMAPYASRATKQTLTRSSRNRRRTCWISDSAGSTSR